MKFFSRQLFLVALAGSLSFSCSLSKADIPTPVLTGKSTLPEVNLGSIKLDEDTLKKDVYAAFLANEFDKIDAVQAALLQSFVRTDNGKPLLEVFNEAMEASLQGVGLHDDQYWQSVEKKCAAWHQYNPKSSTAITAYAHTLIDHAWAIRGHGYVDTISDDHWRIIHELAEKAENIMITNKSIGVKDPNWFVVMYKVAQLNNWKHEDYNALINEGAELFPNYYSLYSEATGYMLPQWGGSYDEIEEFANFSADKTRALDGEGAYARFYLRFSHWQSRNSLFKDTKANWLHMKQGFEDILSHYPKSGAGIYNDYAWFACMAHDKEAAFRALNLVGDTPDSYFWDPTITFAHCQNWVGLKPNYNTSFPSLVETPNNYEHAIFVEYLQLIGEIFMVGDFAKLESTYADLILKKTQLPSGEYLQVIFQQAIMDKMYLQKSGDEAYWNRLEKHIQNWIQQYPKSPLAHFMYGYTLLMHARHLDKNAGTSAATFFAALIDKFESLFSRDYLSSAKKYLENTKEVSSQDTLWRNAMMEIAVMQGKDRTIAEQLFHEAAAHDHSLWIVYFCGMRELRNYWKNNVPDELEHYANDAAKYAEKDVGQAMYALIYREFFRENTDNNIFETTKVNWPHMKQGFDDLLLHHPSSWALNNFAFFSCMAKDKETTHKLLEKIGNKTVNGVWSSAPTTTFYYDCSKWAQ